MSEEAPRVVCTAATLEEALSDALWKRARNVTLAIYVPILGRQRAEDFLAEACELSIPPDGAEAWPFATGTDLVKYLSASVKRAYDRHRKRHENARRGGVFEILMAERADPSRSPADLAADRQALDRAVAAIREQFASDPAALALFEARLRPWDPALEAAAPEGKERAAAHMRLQGFIERLAQLEREPAASGEFVDETRAAG